MKRFLALILLFLTLAAGLPSQEKTSVASPEEYTATEFPSWAIELRRAEIIAAGALPVMFLFSQLGFDYVYYVTNSFPTANVPWPVGPGTSVWTETSNSSALAAKNLTLLIASASLSLTVAAADWAVGRWAQRP